MFLDTRWDLNMFYESFQIGQLATNYMQSKQKFTFCFYERVNFAGELFDHEDLDLECFVFSSFFKDFLFDPMIPEN